MFLLTALTGVVYLREGFTAFPSGWRSSGGGWEINDGTVALAPPGDSSFAIVKGDSGAVADTLLSPPIPLYPRPDTLYLRFSYAFAGLGVGDTASVVVRTFSGGSWGAWVPVRTFHFSASGRDTLPLPLPADSVQLAFSYSTPEPALYFAIDDVEIAGVSALGRDWEVSEIVAPPYLFVDSLVRVGYRFRNNGDFTDTATVLFGAVSFFTDSTSVVLPPGADTVLYGALAPITTGYVGLYAAVSSPSDTFHGNDTLTLSLRVYPTPTTEITSSPYPPPLVDGLVWANEGFVPPWDSAAKVSASAWLDGAPTGACTLAVVHDDTTVTFGLVLSTDTRPDPGDLLLVALDDDGDGSWDPDSSEGWNLIYPGGWYSTPLPGIAPPSYRPELGPLFSFHFNPSETYKRQVEWRLRRYGTPGPENLRGDTVRLMLLYRNGEDDKVLCRWPQTASSEDPNTFGTLILRRGLEVTERLSVIGEGGVKVYSASGRFVGPSLEGLPPGVYFVLSGGRVRTVVIR